MGIADNIKGLLRNKTDEIDDLVKGRGNSLMKTFSFTSIGGGTGTSGLIVYLAQHLAKYENKQVCVVDLNFLQPDLLYNFNVDVTTENTIMNYIKGSANLKQCLIQDSVLKNIRLVTASPKDDLLLMMNIDTEKEVIGKLLTTLNIFDVVLINLPYHPAMITFVEPLNHIDRGYVVLDERLSNLKKLDEFLNFLHRFQAKGNVFNNVVLNKRTDYAFPYELIESYNSRLVSELPLELDLIQYMNEKTPLISREISKEYQEGVLDLLSDMLD